jgi:hypothetical protein
LDQGLHPGAKRNLIYRSGESRPPPRHRSRIRGAELSKSVEHGRQVDGVDLIGLSLACGELQHGTRNLVLKIGRKALHDIHCLVQ